MKTLTSYETKALCYAEKFGIIDYEVENNVMYYTESYPNEGDFYATVDLDTMNETRTQLTLLKGRKLRIGQRVKVYFNLHKKCFSIKDVKSGLVVAHAPVVFVEDCDFKVSQKGRERVIREKKKNVHAFVIGTFQNGVFSAQTTRTEKAYYNPYKVDAFKDESNGTIVFHKYVRCEHKQITLCL